MYILSENGRIILNADFVKWFGTSHSTNDLNDKHFALGRDLEAVSAASAGLQKKRRRWDVKTNQSARKRHGLVQPA